MSAPLTQSATLLGWLRLAHRLLKDVLVEQLEALRVQMVDFDLKWIAKINEMKGNSLPENPYRSRFIHLLNLNTMFEFCIPVIQDYGAALKLNDWERFKNCYYRLFLFFSMCTTKGVADYQRTMYINLIMMEYWQEKKLPIMDMLRKNPTFFSEESGEIALSTHRCRSPILAMPSST